MSDQRKRTSDAARNAWAEFRARAAALHVEVLDDDPALSPLRTIWGQAFAAAQLLAIAEPAAGHMEQWRVEICDKIILAMADAGAAIGTAIGRSARVARHSVDAPEVLLPRLSTEIDFATQAGRDLAMQDFILAGAAMAKLIAKAEALPAALRKVEDGQDLSASGAAAKRLIGERIRELGRSLKDRNPKLTPNAVADMLLNDETLGIKTSQSTIRHHLKPLWADLRKKSQDQG